MTTRRALVTSLVLFGAAALVAWAAQAQERGCRVPPTYACRPATWPCATGISSCYIAVATPTPGPTPTPRPVVTPTPRPVVTPTPVIPPTPGPTPPPTVTPTPPTDETELTVTPMLRLDPAKVTWTATGNVLVYDGRLRYILICPPASQPQNCWKAYYTARRPQ